MQQGTQLKVFAEDFVVSGSDDDFDVETLNGSGQNTVKKRKIPIARYMKRVAMKLMIMRRVC